MTALLCCYFLLTALKGTAQGDTVDEKFNPYLKPFFLPGMTCAAISLFWVTPISLRHATPPPRVSQISKRDIFYQHVFSILHLQEQKVRAGLSDICYTLGCHANTTTYRHFSEILT